MDNPSAREQANDTLIRNFMDVFAEKDATKLAAFLADDVVFESWGDRPLSGSSAVVDLWAGVFRNFAEVKFETVNQAVSGDVVIAEQIHGLALRPGRLAPIMNLAVYEIRGGKIAAWRDYTNPQHAQTLL